MEKISLISSTPTLQTKVETFYIKKFSPLPLPPAPSASAGTGFPRGASRGTLKGRGTCNNSPHFIKENSNICEFEFDSPPVRAPGP